VGAEEGLRGRLHRQGHRHRRARPGRRRGDPVDGCAGRKSSIGRRSNFTAPISDAQRINFNAQYPNRYAFEHAHSERNPEHDWDNHVVRSVEFAFWALNEEYPFRPRDPGGPRPGPRFTFDNTLVIGSSVSNGGGASLRAAEQAPAGMFDGIAVSEPNVNPRYDARIAIKQGADAPLKRHSRPLFDYITFYNLFQGCATSALPLAPNTCQSLKDAGLLAGTTFAEQAAEAQRKINAYGLLEEQNHAAQTYWATSVYQSVSVTYANAYARASVLDNLCGYSFAATATATPFQPVPLPDATDALLFGVANGIPPTAGIQLVNNLSVGGPTRNDLSISPTFNRQDQNVSGALCLRALATGYARGDGPTTQRALYREIRESIGQIRADGRLGGIPTVIVHGRSDALIAPNHTSRPYYALSLKADGRRSRIAYYEILNAQHLDAFNGIFPEFAARYIPLHYYFIQALDLIYAHLTEGTPLPASQVVRTTPRGAAATPITAGNLPPIATTPAAGNRITFDGRTLRIPD
jgi:hydroxybutyrate-dimer hydrolase